MKSAKELLSRKGVSSIGFDYVCPSCNWRPQEKSASGTLLAPPAIQKQIHEFFKSSIERGRLAQMQENPEELAKKQAEQKKERARKQLLSVGAPWMTVEQITSGAVSSESNAINAVFAFMDSSKSLLLLSGGVGTGKTTAAVIGLGVAQEKGWRSSFFNTDSLAFNMFEEKNKEQIELAQKAEFIVLDDLGVEAANPYWLSAVDAIVAARYRQDMRGKNGQAKAILSTNLDPNAFRQRYGERVVDRIREVGTIAMCGTKSMRRE